MKNLSIFLILLFALSVAGQTAPTPTPTPLTLENVDEIYGDMDIVADGRLPKMVRVTGKVVDVHDGDTIRMIDDSKTQYKCRFNGIDAPELKQDFGNRSKQSLSDMVFGKIVTIEYDKVDKYGRFVCKILLDGMDVNLEQIKRGMAWHYKKYQDEQSEADRKFYAEAEVKAREQKLGLWAQPNATPPWDWRRGVNNPNLEGVPKGAILGNTNSMIYHTPGCSSYAKVSPQNRIIFKDEKEAITKGYRLSSQCESTLPIEERPQVTKTERKYIRGSRGGCYYENASGKKTYVDKEFCAETTKPNNSTQTNNSGNTSNNSTQTTNQSNTNTQTTQTNNTSTTQTTTDNQTTTTTTENKKQDKDKPTRTYIKGSRGGCYYLNDSGKKVYVDKELCN